MPGLVTVPQGFLLRQQMARKVGGLHTALGGRDHSQNAARGVTLGAVRCEVFGSLLPSSGNV